AAAVEDAFRSEWGRVLGAVARSTGDLDLAEESAQEAFATALRTWVRDGVPDAPGAWLTTTARRHAIDVLRRRRTESEKTATAARLAAPLQAPLQDAAPDDGPSDPDGDLLRLLYTCCH